MDEIGGDLEDYDENQEKTATALNQMKREVEEYNKLGRCNSNLQSETIASKHCYANHIT